MNLAIRDSLPVRVRCGMSVVSPNCPDNKVHRANTGPTWGRQDPGGPILAPWTLLSGCLCCTSVTTELCMVSYFIPYSVMSLGSWSNIKMSQQYIKSHYGDKMVIRLSDLHNEIPVLVRRHFYIKSAPQFWLAYNYGRWIRIPCLSCQHDRLR